MRRAIAAAVLCAAALCTIAGDTWTPGVLTGKGTGITPKGGWFTVPSFTTSLLPASPENGAIVYDTTTNTLKCYENGSWVPVRDGAGVTAHEELSNLDYASAGHTGFVADYSNPHFGTINMGGYVGDDPPVWAPTGTWVGSTNTIDAGAINLSPGGLVNLMSDDQYAHGIMAESSVYGTLLHSYGIDSYHRDGGDIILNGSDILYLNYNSNGNVEMCYGGGEVDVKGTLSVDGSSYVHYMEVNGQIRQSRNAASTDNVMEFYEAGEDPVLKSFFDHDYKWNTAGYVVLGSSGAAPLTISNDGFDKVAATDQIINITNSGAGSASLEIEGNTAWHGGNDGSGSGLDADTVDGTHASSFLTTEADTLASVTGRGDASTSTATAFNGGLTGEGIRNTAVDMAAGDAAFTLSEGGSVRRVWHLYTFTAASLGSGHALQTYDFLLCTLPAHTTITRAFMYRTSALTGSVDSVTFVLGNDPDMGIILNSLDMATAEVIGQTGGDYGGEMNTFSGYQSVYTWSTTTPIYLRVDTSGSSDVCHGGSSDCHLDDLAGLAGTVAIETISMP